MLPTVDYVCNIMCMYSSSSTGYYVCTYVWSWHIAEGMDQPGKVANPVRGQLNRENEYFPVPVRA